MKYLFADIFLSGSLKRVEFKNNLKKSFLIIIESDLANLE